MNFGKSLKGVPVDFDVFEDPRDSTLKALSKSIKSTEPLTLEDSVWLMEETRKLTEDLFPVRVKREGKPKRD